jgi:hypothetical protein
MGEAAIRRITVQGQPRQIVHKTLTSKIPKKGLVKAGRHGMRYSKCLKEVTANLVYPAKPSFRTEGEIKVFHDKN